jgi:hypothetical protein
VPVRQRAQDLKVLAGGHQPLVAQHRAQRRDLLGFPLGEIGEGTVFDLIAIAIGLAQEHRGWRVAIGDDGDVHKNIALYMTTISD